MFASFTAPKQETTGASLNVALYGPNDHLPFELRRLQPATKGTRSFRNIVPVNGTMSGNGVVLECVGTRIGLPVRDCLTAVIYHTEHPLSMLLHCSRDALTPNKECLHYGSTGKTIITAAMYHWRHYLNCAPEDTRVVLVRGICAKHFPHYEGRGPRLIRPFRRFYGKDVFLDTARGELDLMAVASRQLALAQIGPEQIDEIGACTYESAELSSRRRDGTSPEAVQRQNMVVMSWEQ